MLLNNTTLTCLLEFAKRGAAGVVLLNSTFFFPLTHEREETCATSQNTAHRNLSSVSVVKIETAV